MKKLQTNMLPRLIAVAAITLGTTTLQALAVASSDAGTPNKVQATDDPYNLPKSGPVMAAGSTAASASFDKNILPSLQKFISTKLPDGHNNLNSGVFQVDPNKLVLQTAQSVTATFVNDGGAFDSAVGVDVLAKGAPAPAGWWQEVTSPTAKLVFPNAGSTDSSWPSGPAGTRVSSQPVLPGDFVNLGKYAAGTKLDFFLIANGANGGGTVFSADESLNPDGFNQHVAGFTTSLFMSKDLSSPYVFLAFKDYWNGGDKDMNDVIIALNVGTATTHALLATPEPAMPLTFSACLGLALFAVRKNRKTAAVTGAQV